MSSLNDYIKFTLDIEDKNIIFSDYSNENINGKIYKIYLIYNVYHAEKKHVNNHAHLLVILSLQGLGLKAVSLGLSSSTYDGLIQHM